LSALPASADGDGGTHQPERGRETMKNWQLFLLIFACFAVTALVDRPEYYSFEFANEPPPKKAARPVDKSVENPAKLVNNPSPIVWR
jgi:hypothetical protein